MTPFTKISSI